jgi:hypothetical protein
MRPLFLGALLLLLTGCFNPDDILPVHGTLTSVDPVAGQVVHLLRDPVAESGPTCSEAKPFKEIAADDSGNYSFDVFRAQATKLTGNGQFCFRVDTAFASGSTVFTDIMGLSGDRALPPFPDWRAQPQRTGGVLYFDPIAPLPADEMAAGDQLTHRAEWFTDDGGLAWVTDDRVGEVDLANMGALVVKRVPMPFDDVTLEDFSGAVRLRAQVTIVEADIGPFGGGATTYEAASGQALPLSGSRVPLSRGLACPALGSPCPLTDGDLTPVDAGSDPFFKVTLTLPAPATLSSIVIRGAETESTLLGVQLVGADGGVLALVQKVLPVTMWSSGVPKFSRRPRRDGGIVLEPQSEARFVTINVDAGVPISEVRIGFGGTVERISEVSLFE